MSDLTDFKRLVYEPEVAALRAENTRLRAAIEDYMLWEPRKAGHAEAHRKLCAALAAATTPNPQDDA